MDTIQYDPLAELWGWGLEQTGDFCLAPSLMYTAIDDYVMALILCSNK